MKRILINAICIWFFTSAVYAEIRIASDIKVFEDDAERRALFLQDFQSFLNPFSMSSASDIPDSVSLETQLLFNEIESFDINDSIEIILFSKMDSDVYQLQFSIADNAVERKSLKAVVELIVKLRSNHFDFHSPVSENSRHWQKYSKENFHFYSPVTIDQATANKFVKLASMYDQKLGTIKIQNNFYCVNSVMEFQKAVGLIYNKAYSGVSYGATSVADSSNNLTVLANKHLGFNHFDPHDLWHDRLKLSQYKNGSYRPVDEGIAYLYGGSWGYDWDYIFKAFVAQISNGAKVDYLAMKQKPVYFQTGEYRNSADYIVNALLVREIEKAHGFSAVLKLLGVGNSGNPEQAYFEILQKQLGITEKNYNEKIMELIAKNLP